MKIKALLLTLVVSASVFAGCSKQPAPAAAPAATAPATTQTQEKKTDAVTTASIVDNIDALQKALGKDGKYISAITKDLTTDKEIVVDGEKLNGKKDKDGKDAYQRKLALYTQDDKHVVTCRFTLTAPKITFNSSFGSIEHGTFKGDVYVAGKNFKLVNAKIDGNIYFLNEDAQKTFTIADVDPKLDNVKTEITGKQELKK